MRIRLYALFALLFAALFYVGATMTALGLGWAGIQVGGFATHIRGRGIILVGLVALTLLGAALVVLWSLIPRWRTFEAPGPELTRDRHPRLFKEIDRIAAFAGERGPTQVFLVSDVNAFVSEHGGIMGFFSRRIMGIGLPLLANLSVAQFRSVLAHEFGHFAGGDVKLLPWIGKARSAMIQTAQNLSAGGDTFSEGDLALVGLIFAAIRAPFLWTAKLYLRFT